MESSTKTMVWGLFLTIIGIFTLIILAQHESGLWFGLGLVSLGITLFTISSIWKIAKAGDKILREFK